MKDPDIPEEIRCRNCDVQIERRHVKGPVPVYCEECRVLARKQSARNAQRRRRRPAHEQDLQR